MPLFDLFWAMLWFFVFVAWIWILISIVFDVFRSRDLSGWGKGLWILFIVIVPWLGALIYLIARGGSMHERSQLMAAANEQATQEYIRSVASTSSSTADEVGKLAELRRSGVITEQEFETQKAKLLAS
jgi:hypothetical protein